MKRAFLHIDTFNCILYSFLQKNCNVHKFPRTNDEEPYKPFTPITDGQTFELEGLTLKAFHTPGHTMDSIILHLLVCASNFGYLEGKAQCYDSN